MLACTSIASEKFHWTLECSIKAFYQDKASSCLSGHLLEKSVILFGNISSSVISMGHIREGSGLGDTLFRNVSINKPINSAVISMIYNSEKSSPDFPLSDLIVVL